MALNLGLESLNYNVGGGTTGAVLSYEFINELCQFNNIASELDDLGNSLGALGVAYENLAAIKASIRRRGGATESLIELVGEEFGGRVSMEAADEKKDGVWTKIKSFLVSIWEKIKELFMRWFSSIDKLIARLNDWKTTADNTKTKTENWTGRSFNGVAQADLTTTEENIVTKLGAAIDAAKTAIDSGKASKEGDTDNPYIKADGQDYTHAVVKPTLSEIQHKTLVSAKTYCDALRTTLLAAAQRKASTKGAVEAVLMKLRAGAPGVDKFADNKADTKNRDNYVKKIVGMSKDMQKSVNNVTRALVSSAAAFLAHNTLSKA